MCVSWHYMYGQSHLPEISLLYQVTHYNRYNSRVATLIAHTNTNVCYTNVFYRPSLVITVVSTVPPVGLLLGINVSTAAPALPST